MKARTRRREKVKVITLGCSKNVYDSEVLMKQLEANAIQTVHEGKESSDIVIINTCGFIESAKQESIDTILQFAGLKQQGKIEKLFVTGCLSERYKPELEKSIEGVDAYFGTRDLPRLLKTLNADYKHELVGERLLTTPAHFAYFKISEGCDRTCAFCAIPLMRGGHVSVPMEELVERAKNLASKGVKELILIAQDLTWYGLDLYKKRNLATLVDKLSSVNGIEWIRLHYAFPGGFPEDVLDVMKDRENVCKYLDMPLQHISDRMLKAMRRGISADNTRKLVDRIREKVPGIAMRTTMLTGFPGETEEDFEALLSFIEDYRFDRLGVFTYSHEEGTFGFDLEDDVSAALKEERASRLMAVQERISTQVNEKKVGSVFKIMVDKKENGFYSGRTEADSPEVDNEVLVDASKHFLRIGDFCKVKITGSQAFDLFGEPEGKD